MAGHGAIEGHQWGRNGGHKVPLLVMKNERRGVGSCGVSGHLAARLPGLASGTQGQSAGGAVPGAAAPGVGRSVSRFGARLSAGAGLRGRVESGVG